MVMATTGSQFLPQPVQVLPPPAADTTPSGSGGPPQLDILHVLGNAHTGGATKVAGNVTRPVHPGNQMGQLQQLLQMFMGGQQGGGQGGGGVMQILQMLLAGMRR